MKKIAHFIDTNVPGGAELLIIDICRNLKKYNYQPEVFHFGNPWLVKKCAQLDIPCLLVPGYKLYKSFKTLPIFTVVFRNFIKQRKIDLLHSHLFGPITGSCFATFIARIPHLGTLHDTYTIDEKKNRMYLLRLASIIGTQLVTVSEDMRDYLCNNIRFSEFKKNDIKVVLNGIDLKAYSQMRDNKLRSQLKISESDIVFICVGRLAKIKRHDVLIKAFSKLDTKKDVKLLIVGEGPTKQKIERLIVKLGLSKSVKMLGFRSDVPNLLAASDCFILSSQSEGLSYSITEAMASGLPVVVTDVGGNKELVLNEQSGYLVPPNNLDLFAEKMQCIIDDNKKRKQFGNKAKEIAHEKFSITTMIEKYINIYKKMI